MLALAATAGAWELRGPDGVPTGRSLPLAAVLAPGALPVGAVRPSADALGAVAEATAHELLEQYAEGTAYADPGMLAEAGVTLEDVLDTLWLVGRVAREDPPEAERLDDPAWLAATFDAWTWTPDREGAAARKVTVDHRIRLTNYAVFEADGSPVRTPTHDTALYAAPADDALRTALTRMDVYAGAFEPGGAHAGAAAPLVWLARADANEALMQGSTVAVVEGRKRVFNVHVNNGLPYDPRQRDGNRQARFWYFREVDGILGVAQIPLRPRVAVAGDVFDLGLGKLVALAFTATSGVPELQLAILADTGGAFEPNLFQLDWLAGTFPTPAAYDAWNATAPTRATATLLVRKRAP